MFVASIPAACECERVTDFGSSGGELGQRAHWRFEVGRDMCH